MHMKKFGTNCWPIGPLKGMRHMKFMNLVQKPGEPTSTYIVRLREASEDCDFGDADAVDRRIREQVLLSGNNTKLKGRPWKVIETSLKLSTMPSSWKIQAVKWKICL